MRMELQHIDSDAEALGWALGSIRAGFAERLRALRTHNTPSLHSLAVLWIGMLIASSAFNVGLVVATRLRFQGLASAMGRLIEGFHYDRFVPFADAMPMGLFVLMAMVLVLFVVSLSLSLRRRPTAFLAFCSAVALSLAAWLYQLEIPTYVQAISSAHRWRVGICFVMTAGVLSALWFCSTTPKLSLQPLDGEQR